MLARRLLAPAVAASLALVLAACGSDGSDSEDMTAQVNSALTVSGDLGEQPQVEWKGQIDGSGTSVQTLIQGDGEPVEEGDSFFGKLWLGNGHTMKPATGQTWPDQASIINLSAEALPGTELREALEGTDAGSRVMVVTQPAGVFGAETGGTQFGIGNQDPVVVIIDILSSVPDQPSGKEQKAPAWAPKVIESGGVPSGLDFSGVPKPGKDLRVGYLIKGDGDPLTAKDTEVAVNYLGQVYRGKKPFDQSFGKSPFTMSMAGGVVQGWLDGLKGVPVGSRVILSIPPDLGYGSEGRPPEIKGTDTMFFVIDVLAKG